jgi:hypothetical protein
MTKMVINHGTRSGLTPPLLISFLNETLEGTNFNIGKIDINSGNSTFWIESKVVEALDKAIRKSHQHGISVWKDKDQSYTDQPFFKSGRGGKGDIKIGRRDRKDRSGGRNDKGSRRNGKGSSKDKGKGRR